MAKRRKLTNFPWNALPAELQGILLRSLSLSTLGKACRLNKAISAEATPVFWTSIDLKDPKTVDCRCLNCGKRSCSRFDDGSWQPEKWLQGFFLTCHVLQKTRPTRWKELATYMRCLRFVKVPSMYFREWLELAANARRRNSGELTHSEWPFPTPQDLNYYAQEPTIWDVICDLKSLEELEIYVQQYLEDRARAEELAHKMQGALPRLRKLKIGGDVSKDLMSALLSTAHQTLEDLSCIALLDGTVGQDYYSRGLLHLAQVSSKKPFPKLRSLRLCKLAELSESAPTDEDERPSNDESGVPWPLEESDDLDSLQDWAAFIGRVSNNLQSLTLEDCYLVGSNIGGRARLINPGNAYADPRQQVVSGAQDEQASSSEDSSEDSDEADDEEPDDEEPDDEKPDDEEPDDEEPDDGEPDDEEPPGPDPVHWGAGSRRRFRETLLPVLAEQAWPQLKKLVLVGLALPGEGAEPTEAEKPDPNTSFLALRTFLDRLSSQDVDVELRAAGVMTFHYDATPLQVTPSGSWQG